MHKSYWNVEFRRRRRRRRRFSTTFTRRSKSLNKEEQLFRREPWSSGNGRRLMFQRSGVQILAPNTGWTFFTFICCRNCNLCLKIENKWKRGRGRPICIKKNNYPQVVDNIDLNFSDISFFLHRTCCKFRPSYKCEFHFFPEMFQSISPR